MTDRSKIEEAFDAMLNAEEGHVYIIPCSSYNEAERIRVRLYTEKNKLRRFHVEMAELINISRGREEDGVYTVTLTKVAATPLDKAVSISPSGKIQSSQEFLATAQHTLHLGEPEELKRVRKTFERRGYDAEEVEKQIELYKERNPSLLDSKKEEEIERMETLAREDGMSEEEIADLRTEMAGKEADAVMTKVGKLEKKGKGKGIEVSEEEQKRMLEAEKSTDVEEELEDEVA